MKLAELLPALHELPRAEKFRAVQFLTADLAHEDASVLAAGDYPIWSPHDAGDAARTLTQYLHEETESR